MRDFLQLPEKVEPFTDYGINAPIYGHEYLVVPDDDIRWQACIDDSHPCQYDLPVVFFEVIAQRFAKTSDFKRFIYRLPVPIVLRKYFDDNPDLLPPYISKIIDYFPAIFSRAGYISDSNSLESGITLEFDKDDLSSLYANLLKTASAKDAAPIGERLAKLKGWDAPDVNVNLNSENSTQDIAKILNSISNSPRVNTKFFPLPKDFLE